MSRWLVISGAETALRLRVPDAGALRIGSDLACDVRCTEAGIEPIHAEVFWADEFGIRACASDVAILEDAEGATERRVPVGTTSDLAPHERGRVGPLEVSLCAGLGFDDGPRLWDVDEVAAQIRAHPSGIVVHVEGGDDISDRLLEWVGPQDRIAPLGSGAFAVFLPGGQPVDAANLLESLGSPETSRAGVALVDPERAEGAIEAARPSSAPFEARWVHSDDPTLQNLAARVEQAASSDGATLVLGETGTGKDLLIADIHRRSTRRFGPLVHVSAIELEASGLSRQALERAAGGFLVVDEVSALSPRAQLALAQQLEQVLPGRPRVLATSNRDLDRLVSEGAFRNDLFFRLAWFRLDIPPLRERPGHIVELIRWFLEREGILELPSSPALQALTTYRWPGNVRQLEATISRAARSCLGHPIRLTDLPPELQIPQDPSEPSRDLEDTLESNEPMKLRDEMAALERRRILQALERSPNQTEAAKALGIPLRTFLNRMDALGIPRARKR